MKKNTPPVKNFILATTAITPSKIHSETLKIIEKTVETIITKDSSVSLIQFGEAIVGWYSPADMIKNAETVPGPSSMFIAELAKKHAIYISFGIPVIRDGLYYNSQMVVAPDGSICAIHDKYKLKSGEIKAGFSPGKKKITLLDIAGLKTAMIICADASHTAVIKELRRSKCDLILYSLADDEDKDWLGARIIAHLYNAWVVSANRFGHENCFWNGHLIISDPDGKIVQRSVEKETLFIQNITIKKYSFITKIIRSIKRHSCLVWIAASNFMTIYRLMK